MKSADNTDVIAQKILGLAIRGGSNDNITIAVVQLIKKN